MDKSVINDSIEVHRHFDAAPAIVFAAFSDPTLVRRWLKPGPAIGLEIVEFDFRPGGRYRFAYSAPGVSVMRVNGVFSIVEPPTRLVFSWNIEPPDEHAGIASEVQVSIRAAGTGSELRIRHVKLSAAGAPARHDAGWRGALDGLADLLANGEGEGN